MIPVGGPPWRHAPQNARRLSFRLSWVSSTLILHKLIVIVPPPSTQHPTVRQTSNRRVRIYKGE